MISILIPVYDFDVRKLVLTLSDQITASHLACEIICLDDGSQEKYRSINREIDTTPHVSYQELESNVGRSAIRNKLAKLAQKPHLLFIDCDSEVPDDQYLERYLVKVKHNTVLYGGRIYSETKPDEQHYFRWYYGTAREVTSAKKRAENPYQSFMTNNFLIPFEVFENIQFNESITRYGHEDTLFGLELKVAEVPIIHIDNPLVHIGLETTDEFLEKSRHGVENLLKLYKDGKVTDQVKLLKAFKFVQRTRMIPTLAARYEKKHKSWENNFRSGQPNLKLFDLYKLSYMCYLEITSSII